MNKAELIKAVASRAGISNADASSAVDGVFDTITDTLRGGSDVRLAGFGSFGVVHRKATSGRNPRTGEAISIAASNQPKFKAGKTLKDAVNN